MKTFDFLNYFNKDLFFVLKSTMFKLYPSIKFESFNDNGAIVLAGEETWVSHDTECYPKSFISGQVNAIQNSCEFT